MFDLSHRKCRICRIYRLGLHNIIYPPTNTMTVGRTFETIDEVDFIGVITVPKSTIGEPIIEVEEVGENKYVVLSKFGKNVECIYTIVRIKNQHQIIIVILS